jgi:microcystin-dependent protein
LSARKLGSKGGAEKVTLTLNQTPSHTHTAQASNNAATSAPLNGNVLAKGVDASDKFYVAPVAGQQRAMVAGMVANTGGSQPHTNLMPTLCSHFIVALVGIYPSRQ